MIAGFRALAGRPARTRQSQTMTTSMATSATTMQQESCPMKHRIVPLLLLAALAAPSAHAEKADRARPMQIEADALRHDEARQTSLFSGHVVVTKGSIVLRGARLQLRQDADGNQYGLVSAEAGARAFFRQKRDTPAGAPAEYMEGEGETIEYDGKADRVRLVARAELRRYREAQLSDEISGAVIVYDNRSELFSVDGQGAGAPAPGAGRVRAVIAPKNPAAAASAPAPAAPGGAQ